ncbi:hypothetical protein FA95DRAFT_1674291 [Auriscalpium vulgare]|uniref:Uncharacterized protein n=1 Tax=Auriscalpium vulgare TaxID=40419 RepID=A0ACB8SCV4_9AGAM|nr:hypothetical protein FA95DRAFT_1674291 [Auriscalpium vulgare]
MVRDWFARITFQRSELDMSAEVLLLFLGAVPEDPRSVLLPILRGFTRRRRSRTSTTWISTTAFSSSESYEPDVVVPYLQRELSWRVRKMDRTVVELPSLEVAVFSQLASEETGTYRAVNHDEPQYYPDITRGRKGGWCG